MGIQNHDKQDAHDFGVSCDGDAERGPQDDFCATGIKACNPDSPLMVFIIKMIPTNDKSCFNDFGRVFYGSVATGQKVRIIGPNYVSDGKNDFNIKKIQRNVFMMGAKVEAIPDVPCGHFCPHRF